MQPFSPESIVETKRLNYGEISTQKCMALFRHNDYLVKARLGCAWTVAVVIGWLYL